MFAQDPPVQTLHATNERLRGWLESLAPNSAHPVATPQQMTGLLTDLRRAGEWLRAGLPREKDAELEIELKIYRQNVERLHELLPSIHSHLLQEKARLEAERTRIESAEEWARSSHQTL